MSIAFRESGLRLRQEGEAVLYDEPSQALLKATAFSMYFFYLDQPLQPPREVRISDGPPVVAASLSLDGSMLAMQRSPGNLQFLELTSAKTFVQAAWKGKSPVIGFFWTATPECRFVMVTKSGIETYQLQDNSQGLALVQQYSHTVKWWKYSHEARVLLLGTGEAGIWLQAYQFASEGILRMPPFQIGSATGSAGGSSPPDPAAVSILTLYSRVYCAVLDRRERRLSLFRFYKDAVLMQHRFDVPSATSQFLVVDDLLLAAHPRTGMAAVIDVAADATISVGLPIQIEAAEATGIDEELRMRKLQYLLPNLILDPVAQGVLRCHVDVAGIVAGSKDWGKTVGFVLRRSPALYSCNLPAMALSLMKEALVERAEMETLRRMFDAVVTTHARRLRDASNKVELTPQEVCREVFQWVHEEEAVDAQYLQAAIVEYQASAASFGVELPLMQQILAFEVALQLGQDTQVAMELWGGHDKDCKELAAQLEAWPALRNRQQLANDMRRRVEDYEHVCLSLLQQGKIVEAVRQIRRHDLKHLMTPDLPARAAKEGGVAAFSAVHRVCRATLPPDQQDFDTAASQLELGISES